MAAAGVLADCREGRGAGVGEQGRAGRAEARASRLAGKQASKAG